MSTSAKRRVLVVDDSSVDRMLIAHILSSDPRIEVVGAAASGSQNAKLSSSTLQFVHTRRTRRWRCCGKA